MDKFIDNQSNDEDHTPEKPILPDGYETERLLNGFYEFRKGGDMYRPFQGKFPTEDDAIIAATEHAERPKHSDNE